MTEHLKGISGIAKTFIEAELGAGIPGKVSLGTLGVLAALTAAAMAEKTVHWVVGAVAGTILGVFRPGTAGPEESGIIRALDAASLLFLIGTTVVFGFLNFLMVVIRSPREEVLIPRQIEAPVSTPRQIEAPLSPRIAEPLANQLPDDVGPREP